MSITETLEGFFLFLFWKRFCLKESRVGKYRQKGGNVNTVVREAYTWMSHSQKVLNVPGFKEVIKYVDACHVLLLLINKRFLSR